MEPECCNCGRYYDLDSVPETQIGFCSDQCLREYLEQIDAWFEHLRAKLGDSSSVGRAMD